MKLPLKLTPLAGAVEIPKSKLVDGDDNFVAVVSTEDGEKILLITAFVSKLGNSQLFEPVNWLLEASRILKQIEL